MTFKAKIILGENVPDELNADERRAMELALYFPVVDVNDCKNWNK